MIALGALSIDLLLLMRADIDLMKGLIHRVVEGADFD
jgi:hypothetical protein